MGELKRMVEMKEIPEHLRQEALDWEKELEAIPKDKLGIQERSLHSLANSRNLRTPTRKL